MFRLRKSRIFYSASPTWLARGDRKPKGGLDYALSDDELFA